MHIFTASCISACSFKINEWTFKYRWPYTLYKIFTTTKEVDVTNLITKHLEYYKDVYLFTGALKKYFIITNNNAISTEKFSSIFIIS